MNKRFHPVLLYLAMLLLVMLVSWIGSIIELRHVGGNGQMMLNSVFSAQGVRWLVRNAATAVGKAPIGNAVLIMLMIGIGKGSGFVRALSAPRALSPKEHNALLVSLTVLCVILVVILLGIFASSHLLLGVTGTLTGSPLIEGLVFILMLLFVLPALVFGFSADTFNSVSDCIKAFLSVAQPTATVVLTMLVASQLLETFKYTNLDVILHLSDRFMRVLEFVVYWLPVPFLLLNQKSSPHI